MQAGAGVLERLEKRRVAWKTDAAPPVAARVVRTRSPTKSAAPGRRRRRRKREATVVAYRE